MWLWRGETGLWEPDPATPLELPRQPAGDRLRPEQRARGLRRRPAGPLLSYGKSWTQEPGRTDSRRGIAGRTSPRSPLRAPKRSSPTASSCTPARTPTRRDHRQQRVGLAASTRGPRPRWVPARCRGPSPPCPTAARPSPRRAPRWGARSSSARRRARPGRRPALPGGLRTRRADAVPRRRRSARDRTRGRARDVPAEEELVPAAGLPPDPGRPLPAGQRLRTRRASPDRERLAATRSMNSTTPGNLRAATSTGTRPTCRTRSARCWSIRRAHDGWAVGGVVDNKHALLDTADIYRYPADGTRTTGREAPA